jgi:hypothetical protein
MRGDEHLRCFFDRQFAPDQTEIEHRHPSVLALIDTVVRTKVLEWRAEELDRKALRVVWVVDDDLGCARRRSVLIASVPC